MSSVAEPLTSTGVIYRIAGPVVTATGLSARMYDVVRVGHEKLMGEVIKIVGDKTIIQVYEETTGIRPGEPVEGTGLGLSVELGPGLLQSIYDGIQRPLTILQEKSKSDFIARGLTAPGISREKKWEFKPKLQVGADVKAGSVIGEVQESSNIVHRIMVPANMRGTAKIATITGGSFTVEETVCTLDNGVKIAMLTKWPVRFARPVIEKLRPDIPLRTGQRIFDGLFPLAKGGTAAIPGPFGSGKTVSQQQLAKWSDADLVVYIGCGERGNEMTEVLTEFPHLKDPRTGGMLMERTILIANTSNMPVAAREASVYTGITLAEYYRDMGYDVALMADSTSRWAEAMREISSRLEEMPGEEGYPAYLAARLSQFYERAGRVRTLNDNTGSVSVIGAVSPAGGDFSEPVTQNTLRITKVFWALDAKLAQRRHFPSVNWLTSYSLYSEGFTSYYDKNVSPEWVPLRNWAVALLQKEAELQEIVQLVGSDSLPATEQLLLEVARMIREIFLQQNAYHEMDTYCSMKTQLYLLQTIKKFDELGATAIKRGVTIGQLQKMKSKNDLARARFEGKPETRDESVQGNIERVQKSMEAEFGALSAE